MAGRPLAPGRYRFDDLRPGDFVETASTEITAALIDDFASFTGDRFAIHMDEAAARASGFDGRVAHGLLVLSVIDGLKNQAPAQFAAIASLGWDWSFRRPVLAGDTIGATFLLRGKREVSNPARGILELEVEATNQRGEVAQRGTNLLMVWRAAPR